MGSWKRKARTLVMLALGLMTFSCAVPAQDKQSDYGSDSSHVSLSMRMRIAASIKESVATYFAHWQAVPEIDFDKAFDDYVNEIASTDDRRSFDLATMALLAKLQNGHTDFFDMWFATHGGGGTGLQVAYQRDQWVVLTSKRSGIPPGSVIVSIDGKPIDQFYRSRSAYFVASDERGRRNMLFNFGALFAPEFQVGLRDGKVLKVVRADPGAPLQQSKATLKLPDDVAYHAIQSFSDPRFEKDAIDFIKEHSTAKAIIIDVRGNHGGDTPGDLLAALVTKPYTGWVELSAMSVGLLKAYGDMQVKVDEKSDAEAYGYYGGLHDFFHRPMLYKPGDLIKPSSDPLYTGKLIVLADQVCASACEDFLMPLKVTSRATIIGDITYGSSGQPKVVDYGNGMVLRVGAKRMLFGDGSPFEGVGIKPDIELLPTPEQIAAHEDPVLTEAVQLAQGKRISGG
jgi:carboxyl-terminal processing protease